MPCSCSRALSTKHADTFYVTQRMRLRQRLYISSGSVLRDQSIPKKILPLFFYKINPLNFLRWRIRYPPTPRGRASPPRAPESSPRAHCRPGQVARNPSPNSPHSHHHHILFLPPLPPRSTTDRESLANERSQASERARAAHVHRERQPAAVGPPPRRHPQAAAPWWSQRHQPPRIKPRVRPRERARQRARVVWSG